MSDEHKCRHENVYGDDKHMACRDCGESFAYISPTAVEPPSEKVQPEINNAIDNLRANQFEIYDAMKAEPQQVIPEDLRPKPIHSMHLYSSVDDYTGREETMYVASMIDPYIDRLIERLGAAEQREREISELYNRLLKVAADWEAKLEESEAETDLGRIQASYSSGSQTYEMQKVEQRDRLQSQLSAAEQQVEKAERELSRHASIEEKAHLQTIDERDAAEEALSQAYYLITGRSPEWSNLFGHEQAIEDIDDVQRCLRAEIKSVEAERDKLKDQNLILLNNADAFESKWRTLLSQLGAAEQEYGALESEHSRIVGAMLTERERLRNQLTDAERNIAILTEGCEVWEKRYAELEGECDRLKEQLHEAQFKIECWEEGK